MARKPKQTIHSQFYASAAGQRVLMAESMGQSTDMVNRHIVATVGDYGSDPLGDGKWRMVPSGDIVDYDELRRRLPMKIR